MAQRDGSRRQDSVFPALLRYWRQQRGMSQLDLGLAADVSARHVSFLESGRSHPSVEMVSLLSETLAIPLRDRNELLRGAGFPASYPEPGIDDLLAGPLGLAVDTMLAQHEPYPMLIFDRLYNVVRTNAGGAMFLSLAGVDEPVGTNIMTLLFDDTPRALVTNWHDVAGDILRRVQREAMHRPNDEGLAELMADLLSRPNIPDDWRTPDLLASSDPMVAMRVRVGDDDLAFLATITSFNAPSNVTLDELRIESYLPLDDPTRRFFEALVAG
ncbi:MAG: helix-turn-helix domain-containing protein [Acidimicrobiales bacterium]